MESNCLIPANPDIAGIGIRVSLYAQAILVIVPLVLFPFTPNPFAGSPTSRLARKLFDDISLNMDTILVTGMGLLIAAFVEDRLYDFDLYRGLVVLNPSWLNVLTLILPVMAMMIDQEEGGRSFSKLMRQYAAFIAYFSAVGAYGISLSYRISDFGSFSDCNSATVWAIAGRSVQATTPQLRAFLLALSLMAVIPLFNLILLFYPLVIVLLGPVLVAALVALLVLLLWEGILALFKLVRGRSGCMIGSPSSRSEPIVLAPTRSRFDFPELSDDQQQLLLTLGFLTVNITSAAIIITSTEQLIAFNKHHVGDGENEWTFGQILALLLLVPSLSQVAGRIWTAIRGDGDSSTVAPEDERRGEATPVGMQVTKDGKTADAQRTESKEVAESQAASSNTRHFIGIERVARSKDVLWDDDRQR